MDNNLDKYIWYVEARNHVDDAEFQSAGSAVAVWLKQGSENKGKRYLLTCAHVIRGLSTDDEYGYGRVLPVIWVWKPNSGFMPSQRKDASIVSELDFKPDELPPEMRSVYADDWVLLSVDDPSFTKTAEALDEWGNPPSTPTSPRPDDKPIVIDIVGYPGGKDVFSDNVVRPAQLKGFRITHNSEGVLTIRGSEDTKHGMSGGGVFGPNGVLWGIHRAKKVNTGEYKSISIDYIRRELRNQKINLVPASDQSDQIPGSHGALNQVRNEPRRIHRTQMRTLLLSIEPNGKYWEVSVKLNGKTPSDEAENPIRVDLNSVRIEVAQLFRDWALRRRVTDRKKVNQLGTILYKAILNDVFDGTLQKALTEVKGPERLHVSLMIDSNDDMQQLKHLPWEYLVCTCQNSEVYFAYGDKIAFSRCLNPKSEPVIAKDSLSALVVFARPSGSTEDVISIQKEILDVAAKLQNPEDAKGRPQIQIKVEELKSTDSLVELLKKGNAAGEPCYDILHYIGIGRYSNNKDELLLSGDDYIDVNVFANCLVNRPRPRLVILQQCNGKKADIPADFGEMAPPLIDRDLYGVVAFQDPMDASDIIKFNRSLYELLSKGEPLQIAVQHARWTLSLGSKEGHSFASPALFTRGPEELILVNAKSLGDKNHFRGSKYG